MPEVRLPDPPAVHPVPGIGRNAHRRVAMVVIIALCVAIEAALQGADLGLWGSARWRPLAYEDGGFWAGLLHGWQPNFAAQPATMFVTHAFLHGGATHLLGNMLTLALVAPAAIDRLGTRGFVLLYGLVVLGGGAGFGVLSTNAAPMVGASGAIFGLAAAWAVWAWRERRQAGLRGREAGGPLIVALLGMVAVNGMTWWWLSGQLAWETHLGGALVGAAFAARYPRGEAFAKMRS